MRKRRTKNRQRGGIFKGRRRQRGRRQKGGFPAVAAAIALPTMLKMFGL